MLGNYGKILAALQRYGEAGPVYERALQLAPTNAEIHANYGLALALQEHTLLKHSKRIGCPIVWAAIDFCS